AAEGPYRGAGDRLLRLRQREPKLEAVVQGSGADPRAGGAVALRAAVGGRAAVAAAGSQHQRARREERAEKRPCHSGFGLGEGATGDAEAGRVRVGAAGSRGCGAQTREVLHPPRSRGTHKYNGSMALTAGGKSRAIRTPSAQVPSSSN